MVNRIARWTWGAMLTFMRWGPVKRLRRDWIHWVPEHRRAKAWESFRAQERWARRYGLVTLRYIYMFLLFFLMIQCVAAWVYWQEAQGAFNPLGR